MVRIPLAETYFLYKRFESFEWKTKLVSRDVEIHAWRVFIRDIRMFSSYTIMKTRNTLHKSAQKSNDNENISYMVRSKEYINIFLQLRSFTEPVIQMASY